MSASQYDDVTKASLRHKVWKHLEDSNIALFPRPVFNHIPNYRGATEACSNVTQLDAFKHATSIKIDPDKPLEEIRLLALKNNKQIYVPTPRLKKGLLNLIELSDEATSKELRKRASREGISEFGKEIDLDEDVRVDLMISGCVAVSREGWRIGKGKGYADLEVAMMLLLRIITPETLIITCVHDSQIVDIPASIMQPHDIPVDLIVTPTQVIQCPSRPRPPGVIWSLLTPENLSEIPILNVIREREYYTGADVTLKEAEQYSGRGRGSAGRGKRGSYTPNRYSRNPHREYTAVVEAAIQSAVPVFQREDEETEPATQAATSPVQDYQVISFTEFIAQNPDWPMCKK